MLRMGSRAGVYRLFVAVYPPADRAAGLMASLGDLTLPAHRVTPTGQLHMTLQFIGDRHEREMTDVIESVERSVAGVRAFELVPRRVGALPEHGAARLMALFTDAPAGLLEGQRRLAHRLADPARRSKGRFTPHLTLCRFVEEARPAPAGREVSMEPFPVREVRLMRSVLRPGGAEHAVVHAVALGG
jgi:2'-5' RNA ligase